MYRSNFFLQNGELSGVFFPSRSINRNSYYFLVRKIGEEEGGEKNIFLWSDLQFSIEIDENIYKYIYIYVRERYI